MQEFFKLVARKFYSSKYKETFFWKNIRNFLILGLRLESVSGSPIYNYWDAYTVEK